LRYGWSGKQALRRVKKHLSVPFRNAIFRGIIATERCCIIVSLSFWKLYIPYRTCRWFFRAGKHTKKEFFYAGNIWEWIYIWGWETGWVILNIYSAIIWIYQRSSVDTPIYFLYTRGRLYEGWITL
jgi:hypothetical protein